MEAVEGGYQRAPASPDEGVDVASRPSYARRAAAAGVLVAGALLASGAVARGSTLRVESTTELGSLKSAYCNLTISKQTWSVSDPTSAADFLYKYFPVECETDGGFTDYSLCHHSQGECGSYVRLALNGTNEGEHVPCFGLHMVNAKDRPAGNVSVSEVETHFDARLTDMSTYDPFMDISMMFYANSLQTYVEAFERDGIPYMLLKWRDNSGSNIIDDCADTATSASSVSSDCTEGSVFFSLIVHVPHTQINFELVSSLAPETAGGNANVTDAKERNGASERPIFEDPTVRMSHIALSFAGSAPPGSNDLVPLAISEATSDMATVTEYYTTILSADVDYDSAVGMIVQRRGRVRWSVRHTRPVARDGQPQGGRPRRGRLCRIVEERRSRRAVDDAADDDEDQGLAELHCRVMRCWLRNRTSFLRSSRTAEHRK